MITRSGSYKVYFFCFYYLAFHQSNLIFYCFKSNNDQFSIGSCDKYTVNYDEEANDKSE